MTCWFAVELILVKQVVTIGLAASCCEACVWSWEVKQMQTKEIRGFDRDAEVKTEKKKKQIPCGATVENDPKVRTWLNVLFVF